MTKLEWIGRARSHQGILRDFISTYHPASIRGDAVPKMRITAQAAEQTCEVIRKKIKRAYKDEVDPATKFDRALEAQDYQTVYMLLNAAWFGAPESLSVWEVPGFGTACGLLEDPADDIEADI